MTAAKQGTLIVDNGDWSNSSSWSCGYVPANAGDTMHIQASMTVVIDLNISLYPYSFHQSPASSS